MNRVPVSTLGNAFRINNQEKSAWPITLVIHDRAYVSFVQAGESVFADRYPFAYMGTSPWLGSTVSTSCFPWDHPQNRQLLALLLGQGDYAVFLYAVSPATAAQPGFSAVCAAIKAQFPHARHIVLACCEEQHTDKQALARRIGGEFAAYSTWQEAGLLFHEISDYIAQCPPPAYRDHLNREPAEWNCLSLAEPLDASHNRVLLVGDSISAGYADQVQAYLSPCPVDRLHTSEGTHHPNLYRLLQIALSAYPYRVIHINNGIHLHGISLDDYRHNLISLLQWIHLLAPNTQIVFAATTSASRLSQQPLRDTFQSSHFLLGDRNPVSAAAPQTAHYEYSEADSLVYLQLNAIARQICEEFQIPFLDLFTICVEENLPKSDAVHFQEAGYHRLALAVARQLQEMLTEGTHP